MTNAFHWKGDWRVIREELMNVNWKGSMDRRLWIYDEVNEWKDAASNSVCSLTHWMIKVVPLVSTLGLLGSLSTTHQSAAKDDSPGDPFGHLVYSHTASRSCRLFELCLVDEATTLPLWFENGRAVARIWVWSRKKNIEGIEPHSATGASIFLKKPVHVVGIWTEQN